MRRGYGRREKGGGPRTYPRSGEKHRIAVDRAKKDNPNAQGDELVKAAITANVWQGIEDLLKSSPILAGRVKNGN